MPEGDAGGPRDVRELGGWHLGHRTVGRHRGGQLGDLGFGCNRLGPEHEVRPGGEGGEGHERQEGVAEAAPYGGVVRLHQLIMIVGTLIGIVHSVGFLNGKGEGSGPLKGLPSRAASWCARAG